MKDSQPTATRGATSGRWSVVLLSLPTNPDPSLEEGWESGDSLAKEVMDLDTTRPITRPSDRQPRATTEPLCQDWLFHHKGKECTK